MLHAIVYSSLNVSREQLTDLPFAFHFIPFIYFAFGCFFLCVAVSFRSRGVSFLLVSGSVYVVCCVCIAGFMRILFYLHITRYSLYFMWHFLFIRACLFIRYRARLSTVFYGAKFIFTAYKNIEKERYIQTFVAAILNMLCTVFHHNL